MLFRSAPVVCVGEDAGDIGANDGGSRHSVRRVGEHVDLGIDDEEDACGGHWERSSAATAAGPHWHSADLRAGQTA